LKEKFSDYDVPKESFEVMEYFDHLINNVIKGTTHVSSPFMIGHMVTFFFYSLIFQGSKKKF